VGKDLAGSLARLGNRRRLAQSSLPATLTNLDLAQTTRRQLGDQRG